jgi:hypothetical protein
MLAFQYNTKAFKMSRQIYENQRKPQRMGENVKIYAEKPNFQFVGQMPMLTNEQLSGVFGRFDRLLVWSFRGSKK